MSKNLNNKTKNRKMNEVKGVPINFQSVKNYTPLVQSTLKLFNAVPIESINKSKPTKTILTKTLNHGFILSPEVASNYSEDELLDIIEQAEQEIGLTPHQMNSSFHKSWKKVREAPIFQLVIEQIFHYITTYGYERLGIYDKNSVFIPAEDLKIPNLKEDIKLTVIRGYTRSQLKEKLKNLLESGIALKTVDEIIEIATFCDFKLKDLSNVKNKEVRIRLYDKMDILPELPIEFFRFIIFKKTQDSLIIINKDTITKIKDSDTDVKYLFRQYDQNFGYKRLAEIFLRFKPIFLALRQDKRMAQIINKISHLSKKYHKPLQSSIMNDITGLLKNKEMSINKYAKLKKELETCNIFRKIRLLSALNYRINGSSSMLYKIRNGKGYAKNSEFDNFGEAKSVYDIVLESILKDLNHLRGKTFHIPRNIKYALPATIKQFTGNIPSGSYVVIPKDMIFGIFWTNVGRHRIDLDLSTLSLQHGKVGWDSLYRSDDSNILFSGDITDAPNGASELFYVSRNYEDTLLLCLNYYNYDENIPVPLKILIAEEKPNKSFHEYMVNPNKIQCITKTEIKQKQRILGIAKITRNECRFYFSETALGKSITSRDSEYSSIARDYLEKYTTNMISLNDVLEMAGAKITSKIEKNVIDLSPQTLEKDTIIGLLINK